VRNLPIRITSQGASNSDIPMEERDLKLVASKVGRLHLEKTKLSSCPKYQEKDNKKLR
jgi:hypothetical protein